MTTKFFSHFFYPALIGILILIPITHASSASISPEESVQLASLLTQLQKFSQQLSELLASLLKGETQQATAQVSTNGLMGYWKLDESSGSIANDSSPYANNGTLEKGTARVAGKLGGALSFDGVDDSVVIPSSASLDASFSEMTVSAWVYPTREPGGYTFIASKGDVYQGANWAYDYTWSGNMMFDYRYLAGSHDSSLNRLYSQTNLKLNAWNHVAMTFKSGTVTHYLNGVPDGTKTWTQTTIIPQEGKLYIGSGIGTKYFQGLLDEVQIYNRTLSGAEVKDLYDSVNLVAHWKFDESSGTRASDSSGNNNYGDFSKMDSSLAWRPEFECRVGRCLSFDGTDDSLKVPSSQTLNLTDELTISVWIYPRAAPNGYAAILSRGQVYQGASFSYDFTWGGQMMFDYRWGSAASEYNRLYAKSTLAPNQWYHVALTFKNGTVTHYLNGKLDGSKTFSSLAQAKIISLLTPAYIGTWGHKYFNGRMDDLRVYGRAFTSEEIANLSGIPPQAADTTSPSVPAGLTASAFSTTQINISWSPSTDNVGVIGYRVYRGGVQIATPTNTSYSDTGLSPSTTYSYTVAAYDAAGNMSAQSASVSATTQTPLFGVKKFLIGDRITTTAAINVRSSPSLSAAVISTPNSGLGGLVMRGPVLADGYTWWRLAYDNNLSGWSAENWLERLGPSLHLKFEEGQGTTAKDSSGNENTATFVKNPGWHEDASCKFGKCISLNGVDEYLTIPASPPLKNIQNELTISAWIYPRAAPNGYAAILSKGQVYQGAPFSYDFTWGGQMMFDYRWGSGTSEYNRLYAKSTLAPNQWYHVALTFKNGTVTHYLNGIPDGSKIFSLTSQAKIISLLTPAHIGTWGHKYFNGRMDDLRLYGRALSAQEVQELVSTADVKDFGAKGDGATDDALAIQSAINARNSIFIPSGTYIIRGDLNIPSGKEIWGLGERSILKQPERKQGNHGIFHLSNVTNVFLHDLTFEMTHTGGYIASNDNPLKIYQWNAAVWMEGGYRNRILRSIFRYSWGDGLTIGELYPQELEKRCYDPSTFGECRTNLNPAGYPLIRCQVYEQGSYLVKSCAQHSDDNVVAYNQFSKTGRTGIAITAGNRNTVSYNTFMDSQLDQEPNNRANWVDDNLYSNNIFRGFLAGDSSNYAAISSYDFNDQGLEIPRSTEITNNRFEGVGLLVGGVKNATVKNNTFSGYIGTGKGEPRIVDLNGFNNSTFSENTIDASSYIDPTNPFGTSAAVGVLYSQDSVIEKNEIFGYRYGNGIFARGNTRIRYVLNTIRDNLQNGILLLLSNQDVLIKNNKIQENNTINSPYAAGVSADGDDTQFPDGIRIEGNTINSPSGSKQGPSISIHKARNTRIENNILTPRAAGFPAIQRRNDTDTIILNNTE